MKKFSFLIVCLCAGMTFVSQAQDTERVAPAGSDAPSLNGGKRPREFSEPIVPIGPGSFDGLDGDVDDGDSGNPHSLVGTSPDGLVKGTVKPGGGDAPSLIGGKRPRDWDEPIPGPIPHRLGDWDMDDGDSGNPHRLVGTSPDGLVKGSIRPGGNGGGEQLNGGLKPGLDHPVIRPRPLVNAPGKTPKGITMVTGMIDGMINGSTDVDDVNGDGKSDVKDVTVLIDWLLSTK